MNDIPNHLISIGQVEGIGAEGIITLKGEPRKDHNIGNYKKPNRDGGEEGSGGESSFGQVVQSIASPV